MKPLSVSILSDVHFDSYFPSYGVTETMVRKLFDPIFAPDGMKPADVLIIAGDLGHYNGQSYTIIKMLHEIYFKHIICVLGNHDYYLINRIQMDDYDLNSFKRVQEMRDLLNSINGVHCLDGNIVEIEGIRFGGCDSWYDGQYVLHNLNPHYEHCMDYVRNLWKYTMNDAHNMPNIKRFDELWEIEEPKIEAVYQQCDVMITHVMPSINPEYVDKMYRSDKVTGFFCFDGEKYLKKTTAHTWIYGHSHMNQDIEVHGVRMLANQLGYRNEAIKNGLQDKRLEIYPNIGKSGLSNA
ncbi:metallophosphoesterase [Sulfuricurvum sp.]|uniref:metallophosphoesterase n=1 Tax=Sulfuricurvum sp. TaxID=2025608 RepID=UPI0026124576|nr:metallophosphoesterase [Sulfuricurvum sp.]MDD2781922.1 metallophosphoesterase [Sulfuricurvum sp.]